MRALYFDCSAGVSGDMLVGALLDLGVDLAGLKQRLSSLSLAGYGIEALPVTRCGVAATKFNVDVDEAAQPHRHLADIREIIDSSQLSEAAKRRSILIFQRLAEAEAKVHGTSVEDVHFHEVGAVDSIVDVVGAVLGFEMLGIDRFLSSPLRVGYGTVKTTHGLLPVPAPATAELLRGVPIYGGETEGEYVTPTGAAIVATLCESFGPMPALTIERIGYGAGSRDPEGFPNVLRAVLGEMEETGAADERVMVIETNIDDMSPQVYGFVRERAFALGALDLFLTPVQMKKDRPGVLVTVLCPREKLDGLCELLLSETTTLGVRYYETARRVLERSVEIVQTEHGAVKIKVARRGDRTLHFQPEFEDCAKIAAETGVSLIEIQDSARAAFRALVNSRERK